MELIVTVLLFIGGGLLLNTRSRLSRTEHRLLLVENELRRRIAAEAQPVPRETPVAQKTPQPAPQTPPPPVEKPLPPREIRASVPVVTKTAPEPEPQAPAHVLHQQTPEPAPVKAGPAFNFEDLFGRKLPIWAGGITLAIAGVLIVKYAIDAGFFGRIFTPGVQAICGVLFGLGLIGGAEWAWRRREQVADPRVAQALSGAGISTLYAALLVAHSLYSLIGPMTAFLGLALVTGGALWLSLRHGMPSALLGLAGGLAAPALTMGLDANVPLLAAYLGFTIAGLTGVARVQRWPWLAMIALVGGAGWSLWLIIAGKAFALIGALSIFGFVALLALLIPLFVFSDKTQRITRSVSAIIGAAQLGLLVALGGFQPLHWALFALLASAGQFLAWREKEHDLSIIPTTSTALSFILLMVWDAPTMAMLLTVALVLAAIHAGPLIAQLWQAPTSLQRAIELSGIALAAPILALRHINYPNDTATALASLGGAALVFASAALGWNCAERRQDKRFATLIATGGLLLTLAIWCALPHWQAPLGVMALACALLAFAPRTGDHRIEPIAASFGGLSVLMLLATTIPDRSMELAALFGDSANPFSAQSLLRWAGMALGAAFLAASAKTGKVSHASEAAATLLAYGALAQILPPIALPLAAPLGLLALALHKRQNNVRPLLVPGALLLMLIAGWAFLPVMHWLDLGTRSLGGLPMMLDRTELAPLALLRRLAVPALLIAGAWWLLRDKASRAVNITLATTGAVLGGIALHSFYRHSFAALVGADFVTTGIAQRIVWVAALLGSAAIAQKRNATTAAIALTTAAALHTAWYSLILHNPLWSAQGVGAWPLLNWLAPLFALLPLCILLAERFPGLPTTIAAKLKQPVLMAMGAGFAWASLRQAFHGSLLVTPGVSDAEDIARSLLGIALAIGFLLWGIRQRLHNWRIVSLVLMLAAVAKVFVLDAAGLQGLLRIASFVALGFSLIGIGWLYSRQLRNSPS